MRIAHLTDLHLRHYLPGTSDVPGRQSRDMPAILERAVAVMRACAPDIGVVSGDLVDVPEQWADDPRFQSLAWQDLVLVRDALAGLDIPWVVISGNHDVAALVTRVFATPAEQRVAGHRVVAFEDIESPDRIPYRLGADRERFDRVLADLDEAPQLHIQHYVVQPRLDEGYHHTYADGEALSRRIVDSRRVRLVLSGHYHAGVEPFEMAGTWFSVAPAICVAPFPLMIYDLEASRLAWRRVTLADIP